MSPAGMEPEFKDYMNKQVIEEIKYFLTRYDLQPKVYLSYDRKALFCKNNRDLRITFDTNIRSRLRSEDGARCSWRTLAGAGAVAYGSKG